MKKINIALSLAAIAALAAGGALTAAALEVIPIQVLLLTDVSASNNGKRAVYEEATKVATKILKKDMSKVPAYEVKDLDKQFAKDEAKAKPAKAVLDQGMLSTPVCVIAGTLEFLHPTVAGSSAAATDANDIIGAKMNLRILDLETKKVVDTVRCKSMLPKAVALPPLEGLSKVDFESSPLGQLMHSTAGQAVSALESIAKNEKSPLSTFLRTKKKH